MLHKRSNRRRRTLLELALMAVAMVAAEAAQARVCNQSVPPICDQPYDAVSYATTHNAFAASEASWTFPNQEFWLTRQLNDGVRALMLDVYLYEDTANGIDLDVYLCHASCGLGLRRLTSGLQDIKDFLDANPNEIVSIIFESYVHIDDVVARFNSVGLGPYLHAQTIGQPWPTLNEMIDSGHRLVVFSDRVDVPRSGYHYVWSHALETHFSAATPADFSCNRNRGNQSNPLFILNHFLTQTIGARYLAEQVNHNAYFATRAVECWNERAHLPNFVTVDFYDIGDIFAVVDELNRSRLLSATPPPTHTVTPTVTTTPTPTPYACPPAPSTGCLTGVDSKLRVGRMKSGAKLNYRWKGSVLAADLGDPQGTTSYALCLYADAQLVGQANFPNGSDWRRMGATTLRRYSYKSKRVDGTLKATMNVGASPSGKFMVHADGDRLSLAPSLAGATAATAITAQLLAPGVPQCWTADFSGDVIRLP